MLNEPNPTPVASTVSPTLRTALAWLLLATPFALPLAAHAERAAALDRVSIWLGGFRTDFDGTAQLRSGDGRLDTGELPVFHGHDTVQRAKIDWLLGDAQGFTVDYYRLNRNQSRQAGTGFTIDGTRYDATAQISTHTRADFGNVSYRWWLGSGDAVFGVGVGAGYYRLVLGIDAQGSATGVNAAAGSASTDDRAWAPLGNLGFRYRVADSVRVYADVSGVRFHGGDSRTTLTNGSVGVEWFPWTNLGVGAEYASTQVHYRKQNDAGDLGRINFDLKGPAVYLRLRY